MSLDSSRNKTDPFHFVRLFRYLRSARNKSDNSRKQVRTQSSLSLCPSVLATDNETTNRFYIGAAGSFLLCILPGRAVQMGHYPALYKHIDL